MTPQTRAVWIFATVVWYALSTGQDMTLPVLAHCCDSVVWSTVGILLMALYNLSAKPAWRISLATSAT